MNEKALIESIKADIIIAKNKGASAIETEMLINYLDALLNEIIKKGTPFIKEEKLEHIRAHHANNLARYNWIKEQDIELFKSVIISGQSTLRANILLHGGAALALLAFTGKLVVNPSTKYLVSHFAPIMSCFLIGVLIGVICHGSTYVTQYCYHHKRNTCGHICNISTSVLSIFSYGLFGYACYLCYSIMKSI